MAVLNYKKYKISLAADSSKVQGLKTGDIVRRQYLDGSSTVYSLMCVLSHGVEDGAAYFVGALLDGQPPKSNEQLNFVRITSLFDLSRSGALYLTSSDVESPYMDVIDGIAKTSSLCWPEGLVNPDNIDPASQYVVNGDGMEAEYIEQQGGHSRICRISSNGPQTVAVISQEFYNHVEYGDVVLVSYKVRSTIPVSTHVSLGYSDGTRLDGELDSTAGDVWEYRVHAISVDWAGRKARTVKIETNELSSGGILYIADLNIALLSSISNFADGSKVRVGKLDGIADPVFGQLDGYGGYLQKLYASNAVHISGTLTAGDENGFGATFYAGKIHRNAFLNSLSPACTMPQAPSPIVNPTGVGKVYQVTEQSFITAQNKEWLEEHVGEKCVCSFWMMAYSACIVDCYQNDAFIKKLEFKDQDTFAWRRIAIPFKLTSHRPEDLMLILDPLFSPITDTQYKSLIYWTSPQLELGEFATQYQPTDGTLTYTSEYGAWFSRGGIGGTMQNPLLQLNLDGQGSLGTRSDSFRLGQDGSGFLANRNIQWDSKGRVTFGKDVTLGWENLSEDAKRELQNTSVTILGQDTFIVVQGNNMQYDPGMILLRTEEVNMIGEDVKRQWYYMSESKWTPIEGATSSELTVKPDSQYWDNLPMLTIKYVATLNQINYSDTITIRKQYAEGYVLTVDSEQGQIFRNGACSTILRARIYYRNALLSDEYVESHFNLLWRKYKLSDLEHEVAEWWNMGDVMIDRTKPSLILDYAISGQDVFICELQDKNTFPMTLPFTLS